MGAKIFGASSNSSKLCSAQNQSQFIEKNSEIFDPFTIAKASARLSNRYLVMDTYWDTMDEPASSTTLSMLITIYNVKEFLEVGGGDSSNEVGEARLCDYEVRYKSGSLNPKDWDRVVAVFMLRKEGKQALNFLELLFD